MHILKHTAFIYSTYYENSFENIQMCFFLQKKTSYEKLATTH